MCSKTDTIVTASKKDIMGFEMFGKNPEQSGGILRYSGEDPPTVVHEKEGFGASIRFSRLCLWSTQQNEGRKYGGLCTRAVQEDDTRLLQRLCVLSGF